VSPRGERLTLGEYEILRLTDGTFRVDGGAMFGVVPRTFWAKRMTPDGDNRITLALNSYLIRGPGGTVLVETGVGPDADRRFADFYVIERTAGLRESLAAQGTDPSDVDVVVNSHLHFDHCGGNTLRDSAGGWTPAFPKARYVVQKGEWEQALEPVGRDKPSYLPKRLLALERDGLLVPVEGEVEIMKDIWAVPTPGHTAFHQGVRVRSGSATFFYFGDTIPTAAHLDLPYIMSFDLYPVQTFETKKVLSERAADEGWIVAFSHDPVHAFGTVRRQEKKFAFAPREIG
jgi:glyoxylase-like metal-dependent hydrolase (beta-lactamase superfamily II)